MESSGQESMSLIPGKTKCYNFSFVAKTEDVGKKIEVSVSASVSRNERDIVANSVFSFRWQVLRWCWAVTVAAVCFWAGEGQVEMQPLITKPCRPAGRHADGDEAWRHGQSWTGTTLSCSTAPCKAWFRHSPSIPGNITCQFLHCTEVNRDVQCSACLFLCV